MTMFDWNDDVCCRSRSLRARRTRWSCRRRRTGSCGLRFPAAPTSPRRRRRRPGTRCFGSWGSGRAYRAVGPRPVDRDGDPRRPSWLRPEKQRCHARARPLPRPGGRPSRRRPTLRCRRYRCRRWDRAGCRTSDRPRCPTPRCPLHSHPSRSRRRCRKRQPRTRTRGEPIRIASLRQPDKARSERHVPTREMPRQRAKRSQARL